MKKFLFTFLLIYILFIQNAAGQNNDLFNRISFGAELGAWNPTQLQKSNTPISFRISENNLFTSGFLLTPIKGTLSLRLTFGYYKYTESNDPLHPKRITLLPILIDIKYPLLDDTKISPYVSYGVGSCIALPSESNVEGFQTKNRFGYSINLGAGFDFLILHHWAIGFEFRYHYVKFNNPIIFTDDYSGPKINLSLFYLFK